METDHIQPSASGGENDIENAIPVCFNCHAEIHSYNDRHPRGRKFTPDELLQHKEQWLDTCEKKPEMLINITTSDANVGPLQAMIDEIEFNLAVARAGTGGRHGGPFRNEQFSRAIETGSISLLSPDLKGAIIDAYVALGHSSVVGKAAVAKRAGGMTASVSRVKGSDPTHGFKGCVDLLEDAHQQLLQFLGDREKL